MIKADVLLIIIFAVSILLYSFIFLLLIEKYRAEVTVIRAGIFGITGYFFAYVLISALFFAFDSFSLQKSSLTTLAVGGIGFLVILIIRKLKSLKNLKFDKKEFIFFASIILTVLILSGSKFGYFGMGQDQGVYQTKAIELIYGNNSNVLNFDYALKVLDDEDEYTFFRDNVRILQGYYLVDQKENFYADENSGGETGLEGLYHGVATWPAIMALFGKMFGLSHMLDCQTVFYICFLMIAFYILENFKIKTLCEVASVAILATTPQMIWVSKSSLTEMFLTVILAAFIYLACHEDKNVRLYVWIPVAVFSVYHITIYTLMPLFVVIGWFIMIKDERKRSAVPVIMMLLVYLAGFFYMIKYYTLYSSINYISPLSMYIKNLDNRKLMILVTATVGACLLITIILKSLQNINNYQKALNFIVKNKGIIFKVLSFALMLLAGFYYMNHRSSFPAKANYNPVALSLASGLICIPLAFAGSIAIPHKKIKGLPYVNIFVIFLFFIFWAILLRNEIPYFYYCGRYNAPFLIIPIVFMDVIYREIKKADWLPFVCIASLILYLDYDIVICKTPDDTRVPWNVIEQELSLNHGEKSAILIDDSHDNLTEWMMILKASGVDVYPTDAHSANRVEKLKEYYDNIYYLYTEIEGLYELDVAKITGKNAQELREYSYQRSEDFVYEVTSHIGYPHEFWTQNETTKIYKIITE